MTIAMIEYYYIGGQLYAHVLRIRPGAIWYVTWGDTLIIPHDNKLWPPDDIQ
jgi:hypothetical protein